MSLIGIVRDSVMLFIFCWESGSNTNTFSNCSVIPAFKSVAEELLNTSGLSAVDLLSKALAKAAVSF